MCATFSDSGNKPEVTFCTTVSKRIVLFAKYYCIYTITVLCKFVLVDHQEIEKKCFQLQSYSEIGSETV